MRTECTQQSCRQGRYSEWRSGALLRQNCEVIVGAACHVLHAHSQFVNLSITVCIVVLHPQLTKHWEDDCTEYEMTCPLMKLGGCEFKVRVSGTMKLSDGVISSTGETSCRYGTGRAPSSSKLLRDCTVHTLFESVVGPLVLRSFLRRPHLQELLYAGESLKKPNTKLQMVPPPTRQACGQCGYREALMVTVPI